MTTSPDATPLSWNEELRFGSREGPLAGMGNFLALTADNFLGNIQSHAGGCKQVSPFVRHTYLTPESSNRTSRPLILRHDGGICGASRAWLIRIAARANLPAFHARHRQAWLDSGTPLEVRGQFFAYRDDEKRW